MPNKNDETLAATGGNRTPIRLGPLEILEIAMAIGLVSGLIQVALRYADRGAMIDNINFPTYYTWMAPAADLSVMIALGLGLATVSLLLRFMARPGPVWVALLFLPLFMLAFTLMPRFKLYALALLAAGAAFQLGRLLGRVLPRLARRRRPIRIVIAVALLVVTASSTAVYLQRRSSIADQRAARPRAKASAANVVFVTLDVLRAENTGLHGYERRTTPNLDRWAAGGTVFERAYATTSWTLPSHASMFTGLSASETGTGWRKPLGDEKRTLAEYFRDAGYDTAGFAANWDYCTWRTGLAQGFLHYEDYVIRPETILNCTRLGQLAYRPIARLLGLNRDLYAGRKKAEVLTDDFADWLAERGEARPFFAFLNYIDLHENYDPPPAYAGSFDHRDAESRARRVANLQPKPRRDLLAKMDQYDACLSYVDSQVDRMLKTLEARGLLDRTLVVITSDHGHTFVAHDCDGHGNSLYAETLHVPLVMLRPGQVPAGKQIAQPISLIDIGKTVLDLAELEQAAAFPGRSLRGLIDDSAPVVPSPIILELARGLRPPPRSRNQDGSLNAIIVGDWHYIAYEDPGLPAELFNLELDPFEQRNVAADPEMSDRLAAMKTALVAARAASRTEKR